jgi:hypothetical protein
MITLTGKDDTRFLARGKINWTELEQNLQNPDSLSSKIYFKLKLMLKIRNQHKTFGRGSIEFITLPGSENGKILSFYRTFGAEKWLIIHNMTDKKINITLPEVVEGCVNVFDNITPVQIEAYEFNWLNIS